MSKPINIDFESYSLGDINGQDNWIYGPSHAGSTIDVIAGKSAAWQSTNSGNTEYIRPYDTGIIPGDVVAPGIWFELSWDFYVPSAITALQTSTALTDALNAAPWIVTYVKGFGGADGIKIYHGNGSSYNFGLVTYDAWHTIKVTTDANGVISVTLDGVPQAVSNLLAFPNHTTEKITLFSVDQGYVLADAFRWDNVILYVRQGNTTYKFFLGQ